MESQHETQGADEGTDAGSHAAPIGPGEKLRAARLAKGLDVSFISAETRIPQRHLEALEKEAFEDLPARTYAVGFARNYARSVGLDEAEIAEEVRDRMIDEVERRASVVGAMEPGDPAKLPSAGLAWFGAFAAILLAGGGYAFYNTYYASGPGLGSLLASEEEADQAEELAAAGAPALNADGQVVFTALDDEIWVRFFVEGGDILYEATMARGDIYEVPKTAGEVKLNTGRPQFLGITIDGKEVPKLSEEQVAMVEPVSAAALIARFAPDENAQQTENAQATNTTQPSRPNSGPRPVLTAPSEPAVPRSAPTTAIIPSAPAADVPPEATVQKAAEIEAPTVAQPVPATEEPPAQAVSETPSQGDAEPPQA